MLETEQVENGRMQIVNMNGIFNGAKTKFIRRAVDSAALDTATGEPNAETVRVVVASFFFFAGIV